MGVSAKQRVREIHKITNFPDTPAKLGGLSDLLQPPQRVGDRLERRPAWVEAGGRVLENDLYQSPLGRFGKSAGIRIGNLFAAQLDRARGRLDQLGDQTGCRGLSRSGLSDKADTFALRHIETQTIHGAKLVAAVIVRTISPSQKTQHGSRRAVQRIFMGQAADSQNRRLSRSARFQGTHNG